jgi:hypothetical protein
MSSHYNNQQQQSVSVYAPGFKFMLELPEDKVYHMPSQSLNVTRLVLCANFDARYPATSCSMGNRCKFVHADTTHIERRSIHVNYAWRALTDVTYERFPAGQVLHVAPPNSKVPSDVMDADMVLKTKALQAKRRPLSHCAHYYFNRTCNLGTECQFIHAVFIDPTAKDHQRAPVPSQLGEGRELQLSKKQREGRQRQAMDTVAQHRSNAAPTQHVMPASASASPDMSFARSQGSIVTPPLRAMSMPSPMAALGGMSHSDSPIATPRHHHLEHDAVPTPASSASSACSNCNHSRARFRHDPYSLTAPRVVVFAL